MNRTDMLTILLSIGLFTLLNIFVFASGYSFLIDSIAEHSARVIEVCGGVL